MEQITKPEALKILRKIAKLQSEVESLKQEERSTGKRRLSPIEESMAELWDNEEDEVWND